jgi:hypothetical protein
VPFAIRLTGANRNDWQEALALVDAIPPLRGERGRPRQRPEAFLSLGYALICWQSVRKTWRTP